MLYSLITVITFLANPVKLPIVSITNYKSFGDCNKALILLNDYMKKEIKENDFDAIVNFKRNKNKGILYIQYLNFPLMTFSRCIKKKSD